MRKSKGYWDLSTDPVCISDEEEDEEEEDDDDDDDDVESILIDLDDINSSEIPTDLSINEEEWTDYLNMEQLNDNDSILKDTDNIVTF